MRASNSIFVLEIAAPCDVVFETEPAVPMGASRAAEHHRTSRLTAEKPKSVARARQFYFIASERRKSAFAFNVWCSRFCDGGLIADLSVH
jgi:hypothetical protein